MGRGVGWEVRGEPSERAAPAGSDEAAGGQQPEWREPLVQRRACAQSARARARARAASKRASGLTAAREDDADAQRSARQRHGARGSRGARDDRDDRQARRVREPAAQRRGVRGGAARRRLARHERGRRAGRQRRGRRRRVRQARALQVAVVRHVHGRGQGRAVGHDRWRRRRVAGATEMRGGILDPETLLLHDALLEQRTQSLERRQ